MATARPSPTGTVTKFATLGHGPSPNARSPAVRWMRDLSTAMLTRSRWSTSSQAAIPAAWAMAFAPTKRTKDILLWMLSTKMMPAVGVLVPIYLIYRDFGLLDTKVGLVIVLCLGNLPIVIWMLFTYFKEIPKDILEAARMDGATIAKELFFVLTPMALPGIASTLLLNVILAWNEAFWTLNLSSSAAAPLTTFIASYSSPEGLFWAKLSAASTLAIAPILILGWFSQKQLVRGLTFGAVK